MVDVQKMVDSIIHICESENKSLKNGTAVIAPSEVLHVVVNNSDSNLTLLVFMAPNPNRND